MDGNTPAVGAALTTLNLDGDDIGNTDASADVIHVVSLPATVDAFVLGGAGLDTFNVGTANTLGNPGLLSPVQGDVSVDGEADGADLRVDGSGANAAANYEVTNNRVERSVPAAPLFGGVDYANLTTLLLAVGNGPNVVNVVSTVVPTTVMTNRGSDTINIGGDGVNGGLIPSLVAPRSHDGILGAVTIDGGTGAGLVAPVTPNFDTVNINDQDDTGASTYGISANTVTRTGAASITYNLGGNTEVLNVNGSVTAGSNTFNVTGTSATQSTTVNDGTATTSGTATFNIQGRAQQATATHTYNGFGGADTFTVNLAATALVTGTATTINGGDRASTSATRDRVNLNLAAGDAVARTVGINYSTTGGSAAVTGLSSGTFGVTTTETIVYTGGTDNEDLLTVSGSTNGSEVLSVTPLTPNEANVFLGDTPMLTVPPGTANNTDPGFAGGAAGSDLSLRGLAQATGLTINAGGGAGDRIVVNAPTETGSGVGFSGLPAAGLNSTVRAVNAAFDDVTITQSAVAITNYTAGGGGTALVQTNVGTGFGLIAGEATLTVNTGEEAGVRPAAFGTGNGGGLVADDVNVTLSTLFRIQVNGGTPLPPGAAPLTGDRLDIITPGDANIFSDANDPPNVTITSSVAGVPTQPVTTNSIELTLVTLGSGVVNVFGDNNNTATQADALVILGQDVDSTLGGGDLFGDNEFQLLIGGNNTQSLTNRAPVAVRNVLNLNVSGFAGDDDIVIDPFANSTTPWNVAVNVDAGAGDDDLVYGNVITNVFADATPDGSQATFDEAVVVEATLTPGAGSITSPGAVTITFQGTEDLSFFQNDTSLGDTDTLTIRTPDSAGVPETVTVNPDAAGTDADPIVDIDATVGVQLLQIENLSLVDQNNVQFFALALSFDLRNGADTFVVTPGANGTAINVNGGAPATAPGDTLDVRFAGTTTPTLSVTSGPPSYSGSWTFGNRAAVNFTSFETIFPTVTVAATTQATEPATNGAFTFTRSGDTALPLTINYTIAGTATGGADYATLTGTATFAAGSATVVVPVTVTDDLTFEGPETVIVTVAAGSSYVIGAAPANTSTVTIADNDTQPTVSIAADVSVTEGATALYTVTLSNPSTQIITVQVDTAGVTAVPNVDYTTNAQLLTFAPGQTSLTFSVATNNDLLDEADETFTVTLSSPTNATIDADCGTADGTITDNDTAPSFTIDDVTVDEGAGTATFTVTLSAVSGQTITVDYQTTDGAAVSPADFTATAATTLTFAPGVTTQTVTVSIAEDLLDEAAEAFTLELVNGRT
ncbi:beta strand repeat-containing protein [Urbifossiella limnaea]|uniref:Calx-beta domain protein n=1 Tax=Urbifossiella limnaea TaxID=2528023 RepID=A0A517Y1H5_9BACT|nr:Calx-beta domain-containing protein [Urbifossiella limnaea]QDU23548.1 Calx-beta domain protein [Urbifossiella limnaea]